MNRVLNAIILLALAVSLLPGQNNSALFSGGRARVVDGGILPNPLANPSAYKIAGTAVTIEAWALPFRAVSVVSNRTIVRRPLGSSEDSASSYALYQTYAAGFPQAAFSVSDGVTTISVTDPDTLKPFVWSHLAGTYDGSFLSLYVDGVLKTQTPCTIIMPGSGLGFYMGRFISDGFDGLLDDIRLWNVSRSGAEITANKDVELSGSDPGLAGYWKLDTLYQHSSGFLFIRDESPNKLDLIASGMLIQPYNPTTPIAITSAMVSPATFDLGERYEADNILFPVSITNSGASPLFCKFSTASAEITVNGSIIIVPPSSTIPINLSIRILNAGILSGTIVFEGNIPSPIAIPYSIDAYPLPRLDANNISMWLSNRGTFARNEVTQGAGFEWPKGSGINAVYASGIWVAATVSGGIRTAVAGYSSEFKAGPIVGGVPADPTDRTYRVYNIRVGDNASNPDYAQWPVSLGAPVNPDNTPAIFGDQTLFSVYNDLDPTGHSYLTQPLGAEVQQTTFSFNQPGALQNTVFLRFKIINKSTDTWQNAYVGLWSDPDLGNYSNDHVGIDTSRTMGYTYNGTPTDPTIGTILGYGATPPAVGYDILKGAFFTSPIQAFARYAAGSPDSEPLPGPVGAQRVSYALQGLQFDGSPVIDPGTLLPTKFPFSGDPVTATGWVDTTPSDRRFLFSTGPFDLDPGQSKEMIAAIIVAQGTDYLNSITELRNASDQIQALYDGGQIFGGAVNSVVSTTVAENDSTTLDDLDNSGAQFGVKGGTGGATVEAASYVEAPPGASSITTPAVAGVGKYLEVQVQGNVQWPVEIRIYYTANDLSQAGVTEGDLDGIYYWNGTSNQWILYSNSGADDQGRGPSTTGVNTANVTIGSVNYEGYVWASAYHLTPIIIGAHVPTAPNVAVLFGDAVSHLASLPDNAFRHPAHIRRNVLMAGIMLAQRFYEREKTRAASALLQHGILNVLRGHHSWIKDPSARAEFADMVRDIIHAIGPPAHASVVKSELAMFDEDAIVPRELALSEAYPNPFNPKTSLQFTIPEDGLTVVRVFNMLGEEVGILFNEQAKAGQRYTVEFNGSHLASGMYVVRLEFSGQNVTRKILLTK